mmetsp:Transcript_15871/g.25807  ORF Transcript_15871/g.25807 Transcript_15871/m.25807 type:complete len:95 (+) Transcript_15871:117-401(+)
MPGRFFAILGWHGSIIELCMSTHDLLVQQLTLQAQMTFPLVSLRLRFWNMLGCVCHWSLLIGVFFFFHWSLLPILEPAHCSLALDLCSVHSFCT